MWYLKVSSSLLIAVALICMIQDAISLSIDPKTTEDQWSTLESSTDQNDLKTISKLCKGALNNFNEKLENTKTISNKKLPEPNNTTKDIANLVSDIKNQVKNASADLVTVRKLVQKTALRFRDTFKSLVSFTELDNDSVNKELESIKKITVDIKKPLVNRVIQSFGNRYDLNKLANKVLVISSDREKLKNNYDKKKSIAKKEFNSLWNSLSNHSKTLNDNALKALDTFFEGMKSLKSVKKKVKTVGEDALSEIKKGDDFIKLKNAVELAKSLKLKFEDEWDLDSGELTYSEEQKKPNIKATDNEQSDVQENEGDKANEITSTNYVKPNLPITEVEPIEKYETNIIPQTQAGIEKLPIDNHQTSDKAVSPTEETQLPPEKKNKDVTKIIQPKISETEYNPIDNNVSNTIDSPIEENPSIDNTKNQEKTVNIQPEVSNKDQNSINDDYSKLDSSNKKTLFNPDINNNNVLTTPLKNSINNKGDKRINKITSREKTLILPWKKLIQLDNPHVSQQSTKCESLLNDVSPDFDIIKKAAKSSIQVSKSYKNLQKIENDTVKQFYDKMVDTNTKLCDYLVDAADDVCAKVTPINKRHETKFKNDPNIKRIKYLLGKQYDPNQYILKVLDDANNKIGIGGMKKKTYYKMLAVAHNLDHETKEMEKSALYAMNKIHEGQLAAANLQKKFNKEKASKACYIRNILVENENEDDKRNKDENKEKVKENINDDINTEPLNPDVNLDSVDKILPSIVLDDNENILNNDEDKKPLSESNAFTNPNNQKGDAYKKNFDDRKNTKGSMEQGTQEPNNSSYNPQNKDNINTGIEKNGNNKEKRNITNKITHHRKHRNPNDPNDVSEDHDTIEEIDDEDDESYESKINSEKKHNEVGKRNPNITYRPKISKEIESLEQESQNNLNKSGERNVENITDNQNNDGNTSVKPKVKHRRKRIDPKDGEEISEEYKTSGEEDENSLNKSPEEKSEEDPGSELLDHPDNEHKKETNEHSDTEKVDSDEENITEEQNNDGNISDKPKLKHRRKRIDPKDGKDISEEYKTPGEEYENSLNKSPKEKSEEDPGSELLDHPDNEHKKETNEHSDTEKVDSDEENITEEQNNDRNTSVKPKVKHSRKKIDPKDGKEISEEYKTSREEDENSLNKSPEEKSEKDPGSELLDPPDNEHKIETHEHSETEKVDSDEENITEDQINDGNTSVKSKVKHRRKRIDPKDGKEITEEYETSREEDENKSNKIVKNDSDEMLDSDISNNYDNATDEKEYEEENNEDEKYVNNNYEDSTASPSEHNIEDLDPEYNTEETDELDENENLNSVEGAELNGVDNDNIIAAADSMGEDSSSDESSYKEQGYLDDSNNSQINNKQYDSGDQPKNKLKGHRKRRDPLHSHEISEEDDTVEGEENNSPVAGKNLDTPTGNLGKESTYHESETPNYEDMPENDKISENDEYPDHNQSEEHVVFNENEPEIRSNKEVEKSHEIDQQNDGDNLPDNKKRRRRKPKDPLHSHEISEEYDTVEEEEDNYSVPGENLDSLTGNLAEESTYHESETPDYEDMPENEKIHENDEYPDHNQSEEHKVFNKNEPEIRSNKEVEKSHEIDQQNDEDNLLDNKKRRRRKPKDPLHSHEISEEYDTVEEEEDNSSVAGKNLDKPTENPGGESTYHESETPDYGAMPENEKISENDEYPDHNQSEEHVVFNENEPEIRSNKEIEKSHEIDQQNDGDNLPDKKKRRRRKPKDPLHSHEISKEYDTVEEEDNSSVAGENLDKPTGNSGGESTYHESETPDYGAMPENEKISENDEYPDHNQSEEHVVFNENEPEIRSNKEIEKSHEIDQQNDGDNLPDNKKSRRRKPKDPLHSHEISEEYDTVEEEEDNSSVPGKNLDNPTGNPGGESTYHESETPDYEDMPENEKIHENDEYPDHNQSEEHKVFYENEPAIRSNKEIKKTQEIDQQNDGVNLPDNKKRRRRKRKGPLYSHELSDEYDTVEEDDISPIAGKNLDKPTGNPGGESTYHESETPDYEDMPEIEKIPENHEYPDHNHSEEPEVFFENEPDIRSNEEIEKSHEIDQQNNGENLPDNKKRRRRKRKDPLHSHEMSEEYDRVKEDEDNSSVPGENLDSPTGNLGGESTYHESETPDYEDMPEKEKIHENDEYPDHNQSEEPEMFNENEPEIRSNKEIEKSHEIDQQNNGENLPDNKKRRRRKRKDPLHSHEMSEEYDRVKEDEDNSSVPGENLDSPTGNIGGESTYHESETPDYEDMPENEKIHENDEYPDHNQSEEPEMFNENEPEIRSNKEIEMSHEFDQQNDGDNLPDNKKRRRRKRKGPLYSHELSDEYDTVEEDDISPIAGKNLDKPTGNPGGESTYHESETPDYEDMPEIEKIPENHEYPDHNHSEEPQVFFENEPDIRSNEEIEKSHEIDQQNNGENLPDNKKRRRRKRKDPLHSHEMSEEYDRVKEDEDNSSVPGENLDSPTGNLGGESTYHESETPDYEDMPEIEKIPENHEYPDHNHSEEPEVFFENEPDIRSNEEIEKSHEIDQQNYGENLPDNKKRRRRKRKDPLHSHEMSEEYDRVEEEEDNSSVPGENLDSPTGNLGGESTYHESETPDYEDMPENEKIHENDEYPDHNQSEEPEMFNENEPEIRSNKEIEKSHEFDQQNDGDNLPDNKKRRRRKRKGPLYSHELSDEYDTVEEDDISPIAGKNMDKPTGNPGGESIYHESESPDYEDMPEIEKIPENDEYPDHNHSEEPQVFFENEPDIWSNEEIEKSHEIDQQNNGENLPDNKKRRRRKRKDPLHSHEMSEEYDRVKEDEDNSSVPGENLDSPTGNLGGESTYHESETPDYEDMPENEKIHENDEYPDHNQSEEPEMFNENEPDIRSNKEIEMSHEIDQQNDGDNLPDNKKRRRRKRKGPLYSHELSDEYDTVEEDDISPIAGKNLDKPTGNPGGESTYHDLETPDYEDMPEIEKIPENHEYPDHNLSEEPEVFFENEPDIRSNEEIEKSHEIDQQNNGENLPDNKKRRRRKRKDPLHSHEMSEEYDRVEEEEDNSSVPGENLDSPTGNIGGESTYHESETPDYEDMPENEKIHENDEYPDHNQSEEPEMFNENEPEIRSNKEIEKSHEFDQQNDGDNLPDNKKRRRRKRKGPLYSHELSDEYDTVEEDDISPIAGKNLDKPTGNPGGESTYHESETPDYEDMPEIEKIPENHEYPDHNHSEEPEVFFENEPDIRSNEEIEKSHEIDQQNNGENLPDNKKRRRRKRKDPLHSHEMSEGYDRVEEEEDNSSVPGENLDLLTGNLAEESTYPESETPDYEDMPENEKIPENDEYPDHNQSEEPEVFIENEPEIRSNKEIEKSHEIDQQNDGDYLPDNKMRRRRKRKDPLHSYEMSEGYDRVEDDNNDENVASEASSPNDVNESVIVVEPRPRKLRRRIKSRQPETFNEIYNKPDAVNDDKNVQDELPENENSETTYIDNEIEQPVLSEYSENLDVAPVASAQNDVDEIGNVAKPRPRKLRRRRKSRLPKTVNENNNEPDLVNNENIENNPVEYQEGNYEPIVNEDNIIQEELTGNLNGETTHIDNDNDQPELSQYPENLDVAPEVSSPNDIDESRIVAKSRPRKLRRRKKSRQPKTINENYNKPDAVNDDKNVQDDLSENGYSETTDIDNEIEQPELSEYSENSDVAPVASFSNFVDESGNVVKPRPRKLRRRRKSRKPKTVNANDNEPDVFNDQHIENNPFEDQGVNYGRIPYDDDNVIENDKNNAVDEIAPNSLDTEQMIQNDNKSVENPGIQPNDAGIKPPKKRRLRRIRTYMINKATNERIPINDETYTTTDGLPDTPKNKLEKTEREDSDDTVSNEDNDDYSSFLFKEYNSDQCKRDAYDRFKKVTSQDAKQIAYRSVLDTSEMRSNMLATIKNAIGNVKVSKTLNDVDQSLRTVSYSLKTGLKQTVSDLVTKVIPLAKDFLKTTENLKELYKNGPQSTHKMLSNILESESTVPDSAKDVLKFISPNFDVDELINNIFEKPFNTKSLKEKKAKAQRKLISLSKHMDTAISNIDCFVLSAMSAIGIGADTLKLLKSGRVIMSDKHPRAKALKNAMGIIKSGKKIRNNDVGFTPTLTPSDGFTESDEDDDDEEDPDQVAQKNEEFLKTVPDLDDNIPVPIKVPNKRQSLGVIVVHPDKQIEYKEVTDTSQLKKFVGDQTKKYKLQSKNKHPKFLKLNSKKLIDSMVADVKKKAERNGMSKKEMVEEIIKNLKSS
ncbi:hypothetical protein QTP88_009179 [Uroleucon formosanum]